MTIRKERKRGCETAKRKMQYFIDWGNKIQAGVEMNQAMCKATALCGFTANVFDIKEKKTYNN